MDEVEKVFDQMDKVVRAPWTPSQVESLNQFQRARNFHPFTHTRSEGGEEEVLVATMDGWVCTEHPDYEQDWAWPWMADGSWKTMTILGGS